MERRRPGSPKGQPKPTKRTVDPGFPGRLRDAFTHRGLTTDDVPKIAIEVGCTRAVLWNYLNGKNRTVEALLLFDLADVLKVSARWLLKREGAMAKFEALTPDQARVLQTFSQLVTEKLRDHWISQGEDLQRLQPSLIPSVADPFNGKTTPALRREKVKASR